MNGRVAYWFKGQQIEREEVTILSKDETLARQARKASRFLNSRIFREFGQPEPEQITVVQREPVAFKVKLPRRGRPATVRCEDTAWDIAFEYGLGARVIPVYFN